MAFSSLNNPVLLILAEFSKIKDEARVTIDEKKVEESKESAGGGDENETKEDEPKQKSEDLKSTSASPKPPAQEVN